MISTVITDGTVAAHDQVSGVVEQRRVLILAPTGNDARLTADFLAKAGFVVHCCQGMEQIASEIAVGCGAVLIAEEALGNQAAESLTNALAKQPSWSDVPIAIITKGSEVVHDRLRQICASGRASNVTLLERPFHAQTLVRTVETALRARERQYQVRDLLAAQRSSEKRMQSILESISDAFAVLDQGWRFTYVNPGFLKLVARWFDTPERLLGKTAWEGFPEIVGTEVERLFRSAMDTQQPGTCEIYYEPLELWLEVRAHPSPRALSIYVTDITQRRQAEKALRESEAQYRTLMEGASDGIFVCDPEGHLLMVNPAGCGILGYTHDDLMRMDMQEFYVADIDAKIRGLNEGKALRFEASMRRKDGALIEVEASLTRLSSRLIQSIVRDVTARKRAEYQQRQRSERAQLLSETLAQLLAARDPDSVARELFPKVATHLGVDTFLNFMLDEESNSLRLHACAGLDERELQDLAHLELGESICGTVAQLRCPIVANNVQDSNEPTTELVRRFGFQTYACNPLIVGERLMGTLAFASRTRTSFEEEELDFLEAVAQHTAVALDRLQTTNALRARTRTLEILNKIWGTLAGELDEYRLVQAVTDAGREVSGAAFGAFFYSAARPGESPLVCTSSGAPPEAFESFELPRNAAIFGPALRGEGVVRIPDVLKDLRYSGMDPQLSKPNRHVTLRSFLAAPVVSQSGEVLGGLFFGHPEVNVFTEEAEQIIVGIAAQAAISMDNARLYERVQNAADRLSLSLSAADLGDFTWDATTDLIAISPRTAEIFGVEISPELTRSKLLEQLYSEDQQRAQEALQRSIESRTDYSIEYRVHWADGVERWVAAKGRPYYGMDGRVLGMVGVVQDITQRKRAEAVSEAKRRVLFKLAEGASLQVVLTELARTTELESSNDMRCSILLLDDDGVHLRHGAAPSLPKSYVDAIEGSAIGPNAGSCGAAAHSGEPVYAADIASDPKWEGFREAALAAGLRACWSTPILSSEGKVLGTFAIYYPEAGQLREDDVRIVETANRTAAVAIERRRNERALQESEARQRQLLAGLPVACYTMDAQGRLTFFNDAAVKLWGRSPELEKDLWAGTFSISRSDGTRTSLEESPSVVALREKRSVRGGEAFIMRPDGSRRWVVPHPDPLFDPAGNCIGVINVIVDVTEERHAKRMLQEAKETAEAASAAKDRFLAVLSHELRTPLTPVLMTVASLEMDRDLPQDVREDMAMIRRNVELETKLIDDLLDLSRITSGKLQLRVQPVELNEAVRQVCGICRPQVLEKGIKLEIELDPQVGVVSADSARLQQVLWNVLKNAAKFTPEGGEIHVRTRSIGSMMQVSVRDSGIGIDAETLPRVFDAFEQGKGVTRQFGGLGLGLAISKALVELHGGEIHVQSPGRGKGATFTVHFPCLITAPQSPSSNQGESMQWERNNMKLLLVEDHADTARTLGRLLRTAGFTVKTAHDVETGIQLATGEQFDVLVSDIGLPDGTGYDLIRRLGDNRPGRAIAMSGFGMDDDIRKSREAGFQQHLVKPVNMSELIQALRRVGDS